MNYNNKHKLQENYFNALTGTDDYKRIVGMPIYNSILFESDDEIETYKTLVQNCIDARRNTNLLKRVDKIKKYRRHDEETIDWQAMMAEQYIFLLNFKLDIIGLLNEYSQSNVAEYHLSKGCDFSFVYDGKKINVEIKSTLNDNVKINDRAMNDLIENDAIIIIVRIDRNNEKIELFKCTHDYFLANSEKRKGQNGTNYYQLKLKK